MKVFVCVWFGWWGIFLHAVKFSFQQSCNNNDRDPFANVEILRGFRRVWWIHWFMWRERNSIGNSLLLFFVLRWVDQIIWFFTILLLLVLLLLSVHFVIQSLTRNTSFGIYFCALAQSNGQFAVNSFQWILCFFVSFVVVIFHVDETFHFFFLRTECSSSFVWLATNAMK